MSRLGSPTRPVPGLASPTRRWIRRHRQIIGAGLGVTSVLLVLSSTHTPMPQTTSVVVAGRALSPGARPGPGDVRIAAFPPGLVPAGAITTVAGLPERALATAIGQGEVITTDRFLTPGLIASYGTDIVATPVRLADSGATSLLRPGDVVDVLAADPTSPGATATAARVVAASARVILVGSGREKPTDSMTTSDLSGGSLVVLATTPAVAAALAGAAVTSRLSVVLLAN